MSSFRGFIAIDINISEKIEKIIDELKQSGANLKIVKPKKMHITLKFLGDTKENLKNKISKIIERSVENIEPFEIELKSTGAFPNENYIKVLWIGINKGEIIGEIAKKIDNDLSNIGFKKEKRKFSPHITIARVKSAKNKDEIIKILKKHRDETLLKMKVNSIKLKKSRLTQKGPIYETLKEIEI